MMHFIFHSIVTLNKCHIIFAQKGISADHFFHVFVFTYTWANPNLNFMLTIILFQVMISQGEELMRFCNN